MLKDAASIAPGAEGVLLFPYFTGERSPHWDSQTRASLHGLALGHSRGHVARAALEGVAFTLADVWEALAQADQPAEPARLTGGITRAPIWAQIVADVLGIPLVPVEVADASALGAAILGHWALGNIKTLGVREMPRGSTTAFAPDAERHALYTHRHRAFQSLHRSLG